MPGGNAMENYYYHLPCANNKNISEMLNNIIIIIIIMRFRVCDDILVLAEVNENDDM